MGEEVIRVGGRVAVGNRCWGGEKRWKKKMGAGPPEKGRQKKKIYSAIFNGKQKNEKEKGK